MTLPKRHSLNHVSVPRLHCYINYDLAYFKWNPSLFINVLSVSSVHRFTIFASVEQTNAKSPFSQGKEKMYVRQTTKRCCALHICYSNAVHNASQAACLRECDICKQKRKESERCFEFIKNLYPDLLLGTKIIVGVRRSADINFYFGIVESDKSIGFINDGLQLWEFSCLGDI